MARLRVVKRQRLSDLYGALRNERPFPGKEAVRDEVGRALLDYPDKLSDTDQPDVATVRKSCVDLPPRR